MNDVTGPPDTRGAIPRYRYAREPDESARRFLERVARAASFAYSVDPSQADDQPLFDLDVETIVLPDGVVMRSHARGRLRQVRDRALVESTGADQLFLYFMRSGRLELSPSRSGRAAVAGDIAIADMAHPIELSLDGYEMTIAVIGRAVLPPALRDRQVHGIILSRDNPLTVMAATAMDQLFDASRRLSPDQASKVLHYAIGLLGLALADATHPSQTPVALKTAVETMIDERLGDPRLSPASIAHGLGVSRATLYRAFERRGGVRGLIAARRLERAWSLASSPTGPAREDIAAACGFRRTAQLDAMLTDAFGANCDAIRAATAAVRTDLTARATELMRVSWNRRTRPN